MGEEDKQEDGEDAGAGWAEAMAKILGKETTVSSSSSILLKNKELQKIKAAEREEQLIRRKQVC